MLFLKAKKANKVIFLLSPSENKHIFITKSKRNKTNKNKIYRTRSKKQAKDNYSFRLLRLVIFWMSKSFNK